MLYTETVETGTLALINRLMLDRKFSEFCLVGGTALSLRFGHRESIDIDLFTARSFDAPSIANHLNHKYNADQVRTLTNAVFGFVENVKTDFIAHQYPWINPVETIDGIRMASVNDLAAMKIHAIVQNGTRLKDFIDIYQLLEHIPLKSILDSYLSKYPAGQLNVAQGALLYHNDIDFNVPVRMVKENITWTKIADRLNKAVLYKDKVFQPQNLVKKKRHRGI